MATEQEKMQSTIADLEKLRVKIAERHADNPSLSLRLDSAFTSIRNSLGTTLSSPAPALNRFKPKPIEKMVGSRVRGSKEGIADSQEVKMFQQNAKATYEGFLGRDNNDILNGTEEELIRGVAKLAGLDDFREADVDGEYVEKIKEAIQAKNKLEADQAAEREKIAAENAKKADDGAKKTDAEKEGKPTIAELTAAKKEATKRYTELFGEAPKKNLSGAEINELVEAKLAEK